MVVGFLTALVLTIAVLMLGHRLWAGRDARIYGRSDLLFRCAATLLVLAAAVVLGHGIWLVATYQTLSDVLSLTVGVWLAVGLIGATLLVGAAALVFAIWE